MNFLTEKLAGRNSIDIVEKGILPAPREQEICTWFDICPYIKRYRKFEGEGLLDKNAENKYRYSTVCTTDLFINCEQYKSITQEQLKKFNTKLKHMNSKEAQAFLNELPEEVYRPYLKLILEKTTEAFAKQDERCQTKNKCALDVYYDTEHP